MKKFCKYFFGVLFLVAAAAVISSCGGIKQLETPKNLKIEHEILSWNPIEHASSYFVEANDMTFQTKEASFDLLETILEPDTYTIRVTAIGDLEKYSDSEHSEEVEYVVRSADGIITFMENKDNSTCSITGRGARDFVGKLVIPSTKEGMTVTKIKEGAFQGYKNLTAVYIPDTVKEIDSKAFWGCLDIRRFKVAEENPVYRSEENCLMRREDDALVCGAYGNSIPESTKIIESYAFGGRSNLTEITIPDGVTAMKVCAFESCTGLKKLFFQNCNVDFTGGAFRNTPNLEFIEVAEGNLFLKSEENCVIRRGDNTLLLGLSTSVIPQGVEAIGDYAFELRDMASITIPDSVTSIGVMAFYNCKGLTSITIPRSVKSIGHNAFYGCCSASVTLPDSVTVTGAWHISFEHCDLYSNIKVNDSEANCELGYDGAYPYVISWKYRNIRIGEREGNFVEGTIIPARAGYEFAGWATERGGEVVYAPKVAVRNCYVLGELFFSGRVTAAVCGDESASLELDTTLYAVWRPIK